MQHQKDNQTNLSVGARIAAERKRLGLKQQEVAASCEVSRVMWGRYERDEAVPGLEVMERFAAIGAKPAVLLGKEAPGAWDPAAAEWLLLDELAAQLGLYNKHVERLETIEAQLREDMRRDQGGTDKPASGARGSDMMRLWLSESPYLLGWHGITLESVIELLEFTLSVAGKTMHPSDKATAIVQLLKKVKKSGTDTRAGQHELFTATKELVEKMCN